MTERVLLPIRDFAPWTQAVCQKLINIERKRDVHVTLLYPFEETAVDAFDPAAEDGEAPTANAVARDRVTETEVDTVLGAADVSFDIVGAPHDGEPGRAILETADNRDIDRIYLFSRNRSPVGKATFGSAAQTVLFSAAVPVVIVPPASLEYGTISGSDQ